MKHVFAVTKNESDSDDTLLHFKIKLLVFGVLGQKSTKYFTGVSSLKKG